MSVFEQLFGKILQHADQLADEAHRVRAVHHAVIVGQSERQDRTPPDLSIFDRRLQGRAADAEDRDLRLVDDRREVAAADAALVRDRKASALELIERDLALARALDELVQLLREIGQALFVDVAEHRDDKSRLRIDGDADVKIFLVDDLAGRLVEVVYKKYF